MAPNERGSTGQGVSGVFGSPATAETT